MVVFGLLLPRLPAEGAALPILTDPAPRATPFAAPSDGAAALGERYAPGAPDAAARTP